MGTLAAAGVIDSVHSLSFDDRGRMGWVRWTRGQQPSQRFTLVDRGGATVADIGIDGLAEDASLSKAAWLDGDRWIVAGQGAGDVQAWFLDAATGKLAPIEGFAPRSIKRICRAPGGGFVVLRSLFGEYTIRDQVARYGADGVLVEAKTEPGYGHGDLIRDIAVLTDGTLATLVSMDEVKLWAPGAAEPVVWRLGTLLADAAPGGQPYYADLRADKDGGLIVHDSANDSLLHRITADGKRWQSFHVRGPNGETFRLYDPFAVDPDGRVWASDGARLFRCGEDGRADLALGGPPEGAMAEPVALTLDEKGNIYALEKGTAAVHVFDPAGEPVRVMRPEPGDTPTQDALAWIRVEPDGRVRYRMTYEGPVVVFGADGVRIGTEEVVPSWHDTPPTWRAVRSGGWEENGSEIRRIVVAGGEPGQPLEFRPDGAWLVHIEDAAASPDGTLAVLCDRPTPGAFFGGGDGSMWLCAYNAAGEGRGMVAMERQSLFHGVEVLGSKVALTDEHGLTVFEVPLTLKAVRYSLPGERSYWKILPRPDGTLAAWEHGSRTVRFFALPD